MTESGDTETLIALKEIMEDDFQDLVRTYLEDSQMRIPQLRVQLAAADSEALRLTAHSLKGSSGNLGANIMTKLCWHIELQAAEQKLDGLEATLDQIDAEFEQVTKILLNS